VNGGTDGFRRNDQIGVNGGTDGFRRNDQIGVNGGTDGFRRNDQIGVNGGTDGFRRNDQIGVNGGTDGFRGNDEIGVNGGTDGFRRNDQIGVNGGTDGFRGNDDIGVNGGTDGFRGNDEIGVNGGPETGPIFAHRQRVRYHETDQMGVVYHANYLNWFEIARTEWIRKIGYPYGRLETEGLLLPVLEANVHYRQPAKYDDEVEIEVKMVECTPLRLGFAYVVRRVADGTELAVGSSRHVWMNRSWKPARLDKAMPDLFATLCGLVSGDE